MPALTIDAAEVCNERVFADARTTSPVPRSITVSCCVQNATRPVSGLWKRVVEIFAEVSLRHVPSRAGPRAALARAIMATLADEDDYRRR